MSKQETITILSVNEELGVTLEEILDQIIQTAVYGVANWNMPVDTAYVSGELRAVCNAYESALQQYYAQHMNQSVKVQHGSHQHQGAEMPIHWSSQINNLIQELDDLLHQ